MVKSIRASIYAFLIAMVSFVVLSTTSESASAEDACILNVLGVRVCGTLLNQPLPEVVTVTVTPDPIRIPGPTVTVNVPGPVRTVTEQANPIRIPGPTVTVTENAPSGTATVTATPAPETKTVTADPQPIDPQATATVTETETAQPGPATPGPSSPPPNPADETTVTETATADSGQTGTRPATIPTDEPFFGGDVDLGDGEITAPELGIGLASVLGLMLLILLGMYGGYVLGYKDAERRDTNFLRALRDQIMVR